MHILPALLLGLLVLAGLFAFIIRVLRMSDPDNSEHPDLLQQRAISTLPHIQQEYWSEDELARRLSIRNRTAVRELLQWLVDHDYVSRRWATISDGDNGRVLRYYILPQQDHRLRERSRKRGLTGFSDTSTEAEGTDPSATHSPPEG